MKKLLFTFLAALCCTVMAFANGIKINNIYYILDDENLTATVTYKGTNENVPDGTPEYKGSITIPSTVSYNSKDYKVTSIGDYAFRNCDTRMGEPLISVTIPEGVTSIGTYAFYNCSSMTSVIIPSTVTSIGDGAFTICQSLTLMFQGDIPVSLADDLFNYFWFQLAGKRLPKVVVCDEYKDNYTYFSAKEHTIVSLSDFKAQVLMEITEAQENLGDITDQDFATIESCRSAIESATTPGDVFTNKEIALLTIKLSPSKQDAIATLKDLVKNKVGLDIRRYITAINNATSEEQITEILNNAKEEISNSKTFTVGDKTYYLNNIGPDYTFYGDLIFNDKELYQSGNDFTVDGSITYSRTFANTNWQALYVPFAISYEEWKNKFDVAAINNFHEYTDADGKTIKTELEIRMVKSGTLKPNHPYLIRAKNADESNPQMIFLSTKKIGKSDENSIVCSSVERKYTFTGTYHEMNELKTNDYIFMSGGKLCKAENDDIALLPQRWYLKIESLGSQVDDESGSAYAKAMQFDIKLLDDETTGIDEITVTRTPLRNSVEAIYNLNGMRVNGNYKGIVIKNGKKVYQR